MLSCQSLVLVYAWYLLRVSLETSHYAMVTDDLMRLLSDLQSLIVLVTVLCKFMLVDNTKFDQLTV